MKDVIQRVETELNMVSLSCQVIFITSFSFTLIFSCYFPKLIFKGVHFDPRRSLWRWKRQGEEMLSCKSKNWAIYKSVSWSIKAFSEVDHSGWRYCMCFWNRAQQRWIIYNICFCIVMLWMRVCLCFFTLSY